MISLLLATLLTIQDFNEIPAEKNIIIATKKIEFPDYPGAFNPSIIQKGDRYLLSFRYCPDPIFAAYISYIGIVELDQNFNPISDPQLLDTRALLSEIPSQSEDARLICYRNRYLMVFNDNPHVWAPETPFSERRDMYIAELFENPYRLSFPIMMFIEEKRGQLWQKNWVPFIWNQNLLFSYSIDPHEVLQINFFSGECFSIYKNTYSHFWEYGTLRGGTSAQLVDGEYLSFFHSAIAIPPECYRSLDSWFYFMGAYTFSPFPPFQITKMSQIPIFNDGFYDPQAQGKKVIFPGGFIDAGDVIYLAYGKDDREIWIATIDKEALRQALKPVF